MGPCSLEYHWCWAHRDFLLLRGDKAPEKTHFAVTQSHLAASASGTRCPCMPCHGCAALWCRTGCRRDISTRVTTTGRRWLVSSSGFAGQSGLHGEKAFAAPLIFMLPWECHTRSCLAWGDFSVRSHPCASQHLQLKVT